MGRQATPGWARVPFVIKFVEFGRNTPYECFILEHAQSADRTPLWEGTVTVRIVLADDHVLIRRELRRLLEAEEGWLVCGEAENGREAVGLCDALQPDVVTLDIRMPVMGGLEAARLIREVAPATVVVIVSMDGSEVVAAAARVAGAQGYVLKAEAPDQLVPVIRALLARATHAPPRRQTP